MIFWNRPAQGAARLDGRSAAPRERAARAGGWGAGRGGCLLGLTLDGAGVVCGCGAAGQTTSGTRSQSCTVARAHSPRPSRHIRVPVLTKIYAVPDQANLQFLGSGASHPGCLLWEPPLQGSNSVDGVRQGRQTGPGRLDLAGWLSDCRFLLLLPGPARRVA
jgi:hypothetical protein